jgi:hypothetical protein
MSVTWSHTGVVVDDLDQAMARYGRTLGYTWATPVEHRATFRTQSGDRPVVLRVSYSGGSGHHLELIEQQVGTLFDPGDAARAHHVGYWVEDLAATTSAMVADGHRLVFHGIDEKGAMHGYSFVEPLDGGLLIELLDARRRADVEAWCMGGGLEARGF